jgi:hypothetical protein
MANCEIMDSGDIPIREICGRIELKLIVIATIKKNIDITWRGRIGAKAVTNVEYSKPEQSDLPSAMVKYDFEYRRNMSLRLQICLNSLRDVRGLLSVGEQEDSEKNQDGRRQFELPHTWPLIFDRKVSGQEH